MMAELYAGWRSVRTLIIAVMGDSITINNGGLSAWNNNGYLTWPRELSRQAFKISPGYIRATGGYNMAQISDTHLLEVLALNPRPDACIVYAGTNAGGNSRAIMIDILSSSGPLASL